MSRLRGASKTGSAAPFSGLTNLGNKILQSVGISKDNKPPKDELLLSCKNELNLLKNDIIKIREQFSIYADKVIDTAESCVTLSRSVGDFYKNENQPGRSKSIKTFKEVQDNIATRAVKIFQNQLHSHGGLASELGDWLDEIKRIYDLISKAEEAQQASFNTKKRLKDLQNELQNQQNKSNKNNWMSNIGNNTDNTNELTKKIKKYSDVQKSLSNDYRNQRNSIQQSVNEMMKEKYIIFDRVYVQIMECQSLYFKFQSEQTNKFTNAINYYRKKFPKHNENNFNIKNNEDIVINKGNKNNRRNVPKQTAPKSPPQMNGSNNSSHNNNSNNSTIKPMNGTSNGHTPSNTQSTSTTPPKKLQRKTTNLMGLDFDDEVTNTTTTTNNTTNNTTNINGNNNNSNNTNTNDNNNNNNDEVDLLQFGFDNHDTYSNGNTTNNNGGNNNISQNGNNDDSQWGAFMSGTNNASNISNNNDDDLGYLIDHNNNSNNDKSRKQSWGLGIFDDTPKNSNGSSSNNKTTNNSNDHTDVFGIFEQTPKNTNTSTKPQKKTSLENFMNNMESKNNSDDTNFMSNNNSTKRPSHTKWEDLPPDQRLKLIQQNIDEENEQKAGRRQALDKHEKRLDDWEFDNPVSKTRRNVRTLLTKLQTVLWPELNWKPISLSETLDPTKCKKSYRKAVRVVHPDRSKNRGDTVEQQAICERIFTALDEAWKKEFGK